MPCASRLLVTAPTFCGLKTSVMLQLAPGARLVPQVSVSVKAFRFMPLVTMSEMNTVCGPALVKVTGTGLLDMPTFTVPKFTDVGLKLKLLPVVVRNTCCGLPMAVSVKFRFPVRTPGTVGAAVKVTEQLAPGFKDEPQVLLCV